ncbi:MAG: protein kinase domain-containing protein [Phycisphaerales bacterium]
MPLCPTCRKPVEGSASFCPACGARLSAAPPTDATLSGVTAESPSPRRVPQAFDAPHTPHSSSSASGHAPTPSGSLSSSSLDGGRFAPGEIVAGRYRIVARLGKGGMGEVYRADDVTLAQPVALKFLPPAFAADPDKVQRLLHEVRLTRQISHPNVCRVYDAVTLPPPYPGGAPTVFLAMEYIDGEDLSSLLRRIGRLPGDKALEVARQVCAGLAAAHDLGVIHRDLKPSNIMLDGRGRARLTDFGVAGTAAEIAASGEIATGTPAYMAPEQLNGQDVSVRSDIFSLGLVLYELFTGKTVFKASSMAELRGMHATGTTARPSTIASDIDPLSERVILRCLEKDPAFRPSSALAVSAALPGGDPLAAALAAGETPTPEMVAASGGAGAWSAKVALGCLAGFLLGVLALLAMKDSSGMVRRTPFEYSTEVLRAKALEFVKAHAPPPAAPARYDEACGFSTNWQAVREIETKLTSKERWESLTTGTPSGIVFWYRYAPHSLAPEAGAFALTGPSDPPMTQPGSARLWLDARGRLIEFRALPKVATRPVDPLAPAPKPERAMPEWDAFFAAAGLDRSKFKETEPRQTAPFATDFRLAWTGVLPTQPPFSPIPVRVEAASFEGHPVLFTLVASWHTMPESAAGAGVAQRLGEAMNLIVDLFLLAASPFLAWRHARTGRGDRRGAFCLALFLMATSMGMYALRLAEPMRISSLLLGSNAIARSAWWALFGWMLYMALEPYIRRVAPTAVIGWARMMQGRLRDPIIGRDILVGAVLAAAFSVLIHVSVMIPMWLGAVPPPPLSPNWNWFGGARATLSNTLQGATNAVFVPMYATIVMVGLRWVLRTDKRAIVGLWVVGTLLLTSEFGFLAHGLAIGAIMALAYAIALVRFGLLTMSATFLVSFLINSPPANLDLSSWYAPNWMFPYALALGLACFAAYTSMGGRAGVTALRMGPAPGDRRF